MNMISYVLITKENTEGKLGTCAGMLSFPIQYLSIKGEQATVKAFTQAGIGDTVSIMMGT